MILEDKGDDLIDIGEEILDKLNSNKANIPDLINFIDSNMDSDERKSLYTWIGVRSVISSFIENNSDKSVKALWDEMLKDDRISKEIYDSWLK